MLFERYCAGKRLTAEERAEIADLVANAAAAAEANQLKLTSPPAHAVNPRTGLAHPLAHYAAKLEVSVRTIKRWLADGVKARKPCPLDRLEEFAAWYQATHPQQSLHSRVALQLEQLLARGNAPDPAPGVQVENPSIGGDVEVKEGGAASASVTAPAPGPARPLLALADVASITLEENLSKLKVIHAANVQLLERAFREGTQVEVDARQRNVERSARMVIEAQAALNEHLRELGDLMPREEVKRELLRVHGAMAQSLVGQLVQLGIHRERALSVVSTWFSHLRQSRFGATTMPELHPPAASAA